MERSLKNATAARTVLMITTLCALPLQDGKAEERIYLFTDDQGVLHISNVPSDPRYRAYAQSSSPAGLVQHLPPRASSSTPRSAASDAEHEATIATLPAYDIPAEPTISSSDR
jgi:hypothetical protein